jgi:hypothetical protein
MKKGISVIFSIVFLLLGVSFVLGSVYINEVELNPDSGSEWVELYNDVGTINITGWKLWDNNPSLIFTVTAETILGPGSYYVADGISNKLNNGGDSVSLYDSDDLLIQSTSVLVDGDGDDKTHQRLPDGTGDFDFFIDTKGFMNSDNIRNVPAEYGTIQAAIDAAGPGDTINIAAGTYTENLAINKEVSLVGAGSGVVTISGMHTITSSDVSIVEVTFETTGVAVTIDSSGAIIDDTTISNNIFDLTAGPSVGIYVGGGNPVNKITDLIMDTNVFNGPDNKVCNPWKIGGDYVNGGSDAEIEDIDFINNEVNRCSIPVNMQDGNIKDILMDNNVFRDTDGVLYVWAASGSSPTGILSRFVFTNNDVDGSNTYGIGIDGAAVQGPNFEDANFGTGNRINNNDFEGIVGNYGFGAVSILATLTSYELDAEENWWGACNGPISGSPVSTNVDYTPFIGVCITNKLDDPCTFEDQNAEISADFIGEEIDSVIFSYTINSVTYNKAGVVGPGNKYLYEIPSSELIGGTVSWNVYVNDSYGREYTNGLKTFYVMNTSDLNVVPTDSDGLNGWYTSEPLFSILGDSSLARSYYQWEADEHIQYTAPFRLENIPNQPNVTAGTLKLSYWSEFGVCGNESKNNHTFHIDLTDPLIKNLVPSDGGLVVTGIPEISAYLDEVYQSNSGINLASVIMEVDGAEIPEVINPADVIDAVVSYTPTAPLTDGVHNVRVYAEDNSGRSNELTWSFEVDSSLSGFDLNVVSPAVGDYGSRKIEFDIRMDKEVELLEFMNNNDRRPRWKKLCKNCEEYGVNRIRKKSMKEGENNLTIRATDSLGNIEETEVIFLVDSKKPKIFKVLPKKRSFTNGSDFSVRYTEANLQEILFSFNPEHVVTDCTESGKNVNCDFTYDLSLYDGEEIEYTISVSDALRTTVSKVTKVTVDMTTPDVLNDGDFWEQGSGRLNKYIYFDLEIDETNLDEVNYMDYNARRPKWRRLCSRLKDGHCEKRKSFKKGLHNVDVQVIDEAGNAVVLNVGEFSVV